MRLALILLLIAGCAAEKPAPQPAHIFSGKIDNVLRFSDKVEVVRIGRPVKKRVGGDVRIALTEVLLSGKTYDDSDDRTCTFDPDYIIHFHDRDRVVEVAVAFDCRELEARPNDVMQDQPVRKRFGRTNGGRQLHLLLTQLVPLR